MKGGFCLLKGRSIFSCSKHCLMIISLLRSNEVPLLLSGIHSNLKAPDYCGRMNEIEKKVQNSAGAGLLTVMLYQ